MSYFAWYNGTQICWSLIWGISIRPTYINWNFLITGQVFKFNIVLNFMLNDLSILWFIISNDQIIVISNCFQIKLYQVIRNETSVYKRSIQLQLFWTFEFMQNAIKHSFYHKRAIIFISDWKFNSVSHPIHYSLSAIFLFMYQPGIIFIIFKRS